MLRPSFLKQIKEAFQVNPVVALLGSRQCGKRTLTQFSQNPFGRSKSDIHYFDLEREDHLIRLEKPLLASCQAAPPRGLDVLQIRMFSTGKISAANDADCISDRVHHERGIDLPSENLAAWLNKNNRGKLIFS